MEYQLITSTRRKSIGLQVKNGKVTVRAPKSVGRDVIKQLINSKASWLKEKIDQQALVKCKVTTFTDNSDFWLNGELKILYVCFGERSKITEHNNEVSVVIKKSARNKNQITANNTVESYLNKLLPQRLGQKYQSDETAEGKLAETEIITSPTPTAVKKKLELWLKTKAVNYFESRVADLAQQTKLFPSAIKVRQYKSRWGSCNNRGELSFNYLLMMTPAWVIDYVIIHELCHLKHLNHSRQFWQLVAKHYPLFNEAKTWLKDNQHHLQWSL